MTRPGIQHQTQSTCAIYSAAIAAGENPSDVVGELASSAGVNRPAIWKRLRAGGIIPPYRNKLANTRATRRTNLQLAQAARGMARVERDPCPRCGCRGDYPCGHDRTPLRVSI
jgi:hypothetical protein